MVNEATEKNKHEHSEGVNTPSGGRIVFAILIILITSFNKVNAEDYSNYSSNECLNNVDCVWEAFVKLVANESDEIVNSDKTFSGIVKWNKTINVKTFGNPDKKQQDEFRYYLNKFAKITNSKVKYNQRKAINYLVFYSDNIEKDILVTYSNILLKASDGNSNLINSLYNSYNDSSDCILNIRHDYEMGGIILFLPEKYSNKNSIICTQKNVYLSFGIDITKENLSYSSLDQDKNEKITILDQLLLRILYNPKLKAGMRASEIKVFFNEIYNEEINNIDNWRVIL
ncbi:MAG: hypothetical protein COV35_00430 [Alphaproteobacteria bacterium CG11_big_fil_rev_8_21_14_0_20_39_49]|nr:MAG: hypothetical protein COV35_00430 [Alphaproteobacteria bacterium CG11_big_fil_rev_8_21_14_0_20_39_49]